MIFLSGIRDCRQQENSHNHKAFQHDAGIVLNSRGPSDPSPLILYPCFHLLHRLRPVARGWMRIPEGHVDF